MKTTLIELDPFRQVLAREIYINYQVEVCRLAHTSVKVVPDKVVDHYEVRSDGNLVAFLKA